MQPSSKENLIRVALVEDDVGFQCALKMALHGAPDIRLVHVASTCSEGLKLLAQEAVDVLLVDLGLPDGSGIDVISEAHVRWPSCNIMVSTAFGDELHVMNSLEAGASGYLLKDSDSDKIVLEIRSLHAGGSPISPIIARQILKRLRPAVTAVPESIVRTTDNQLSGRELEVLEHITKGFTADEIAVMLSVSRHTVLTYVRRIYTKLEVSCRAEVISKARKLGLLGD